MWPRVRVGVAVFLAATFIRLPLTPFLESSGGNWREPRCHRAASAAEGLQRVKETRPDLLLSDIGMAEADGYELLRLVRQLPPELGGQTVAVALTAYAGEGDRTRTVAAGFLRHITKPIVPDALVRELESLCREGLVKRRTLPSPQSEQA